MLYDRRSAGEIYVKLYTEFLLLAWNVYEIILDINVNFVADEDLLLQS
jgi:hypothetical protein